MKRNNLSRFLWGCIAGVLLSSTLFFITNNVEFLRRVAPSQSLLFKRTAFLLHDRETLRIENEPFERSLLLPVVVSSLNQTAPTYRNVQKTWGQTVPEWIVAVGTAGLEHERLNEEGLQDHLLVAKECLDFSSNNHPSPKSMFCLTSAIHKAYIHRYDWFVIIPNTTYLAIKRLNVFLAKLDPQKPFYIGNPTSSSSKKRSSFINDGCITYCSMENGLIMSRAALQDLTPHLSWCLRDEPITTSERRDEREEGVEVKSGDIALGCCMKNVLEISCSDSILTSQVNPSALFLSNPTNSWLQQQFLSLALISSFQDMLTVHIHTLSTEMWAHVSNANRHAHLVRQGCLQLPGSNTCNFTAITESSFVLQGLMSKFEPHRASSGGLWDLVNWETVTSNTKFNSYMLDPSSSLSKSSKLELQNVLTKSLNFLGEYVQGMSMVQMKTAYLRYTGSNGREYVLDLEMERNGEKRETWRCNILFSSTSGMIFINTFNTQTVDTRIIEFVVPLSNVKGRLNKFLKMYEDLCLKTKEACSLNLVVYGESDAEFTLKILNILKHIYPEAKLNVSRSVGRFSRGRALDLGMDKLPNSSLMFLCDVDMVIKRDFLKSCQRNTIRGKQVYYPEFFKYYNMDYVYRFSRKTQDLPTINRKHGHWATYSYGMLCLYKSDYISVGGFDLSIEGWGGEDISLAKSIVQRKLEIFRAPEPSLLHLYHDKVCSTDLTALQFAHCISSRNEDIADRSQLAEYVFYLENKYQVKQWQLWGS